MRELCFAQQNGYTRLFLKSFPTKPYCSPQYGMLTGHSQYFLPCCSSCLITRLHTCITMGTMRVLSALDNTRQDTCSWPPSKPTLCDPQFYTLSNEPLSLTRTYHPCKTQVHNIFSYFHGSKVVYER